MPLPQLEQEVEDLRLDRDVERRGWLVEDQEPRTEREGTGDGHPLALASGQLVGAAVKVAPGEADAVEQVGHGRLHRPAPGSEVRPDRLRHQVEHAQPRIQRSLGVLEHELHLAAQRPQLLALQGPDILTADLDPACSRLDQPEQAAGERRLAGAGLAHEGMDLARPDVEVDARDRTDGSPTGVVRLLEATDADEDPVVGCRGRGGRGRRVAGEHGRGHEAAPGSTR